MSRTKKTTGTNSPVKKYLSFKGSKGQLAYYDKNSSEEDKNVYLDSVDFIVLDVKSSVSGFYEAEAASITSNMLDPYSVGKEPFIVKTKVRGTFGEFAKGIWKDIKAEVDAIGGKFTSNIFALADVGDGMEIVKIDLSGAALTPWIEYQNELGSSDEIYDQKITMSKGQLCTRKKGKTVPVSDDEYNKVLAALKKNPLAERPVWFYESKFEGEALTEELADLATENDEVLQDYFDGLSSKEDKPEEEEKAKPTTDPKQAQKEFKSPLPAAGTQEDDDDDLPF